MTTLRGRAQCAPRDVSGDHVLNKRESRRVVEEPLHASLVSYGAWPGDQGRFYSREAEPRVPASRRDAAEEKRGGTVQGARVARGSGKRRRRRDGGEEVRAAIEEKKGCVEPKERERGEL